MDKLMLKENRNNDDPMFPLNVHSLICTKDNNIFTCHWHDELEIVLITKGMATIQVDTSYYELTAGQAIFINSGHIHAGHILNGSDYSYSAVVFSPDLLYSSTYDALQLKYIDPFLKRQAVPLLQISGDAQWEKSVISHVTTIINLFCQKPESYEIGIKAHLFLMLYEVFSNNSMLNYKSNAGDFNKTNRLKKVLGYIQDNYSNKITIGDLSSMVNLSEGYFCCFFKQMMRMTPIEYIHRFRISKSAELLKSSDKKVIEIAMEVGFDNLSYFIHTFRQHMKCTPAEYRKLKP